jgi:hypothetical protein
MRLAAVGLLMVGSVAVAGPTARFGLTYGLEDQAAPNAVEVGPLVAIGERIGPFVGELDWTYLSFFDPAASASGVHRLGLNLRADVLSDVRPGRCGRLWCEQGRTLYAEIGGAERFGRWEVDANTTVPTSSPQPEAHLGVGVEFDNQLHPHRNGWQVGLRFAASPAMTATTPMDPVPTTIAACQVSKGGSCQPSGSSTSNRLATGVFLEWMFLIGS